MRTEKREQDPHQLVGERREWRDPVRKERLSLPQTICDGEDRPFVEERDSPAQEGQLDEQARYAEAPGCASGLSQNVTPNTPRRAKPNTIEAAKKIHDVVESPRNVERARG